MNRLMSIFLFFLGTSFSIGNAATGISLGNVTARPGDTARVKVFLNDSVALGGFQFIVTPPPTGKVTFLSAAASGRAAGWTVSSNASGNGTIVVLYSSTGSSLAAGSDSVLILSYQVSQAATAGTYELQLSDVRVSDAELRPLTDLTIYHGSITLPGEVPAEDRVTISMDYASAYPGDTATLSLTLDNSVDVGGLQFLLSPSPAGKVSLVSAALSGRASGWTISYNASGQGTLFMLYSPTGATLAPGKDNILVLKYLVPYGTASGNIYLQISDVRVSDSSLNPITDFSTTGGSITISRLAAQVNFALDSVRSSAGEKATVSLTLNNAVAVGGFQFIITPTPSGKATFSQVAPVGRAAGWTTSYNSSAEGLLVLLYSPTGAIFAPGEDAVLSFQYDIGALVQPGNILLGLSDIRVSDSNLEPITDFSATNGLITVTEPLQVLGVNPSSVYQDVKDFILKVTGDKFKDGARVEIIGGGILVSKTDFVDAQNLSATITVSSFAIPGLRDVSVVNPDGGVGTGRNLLQVREIPLVSEVNPFYLIQGTDSLYLAINGKGFSRESTVSFPEGGIRVLGLEFKGANQLIALVSVDKTALPGRRKLSLTVPGYETIRTDAVEIKANLPPQLVLPGPLTVQEGDYLTFAVDGIDPEGGPLVFQAGDMPSGASFQNRSFGWTPGYDQAGTYTVKFSVFDRLDAVAQGSVVITVINRNRPPVFVELADHKATAGQQMAFNIIARDPDRDRLNLAAEGLPTGATLSRASDSSFAFAWTPVAEDAGTFRTTFTVSDPFGGADRRSLALTVEVPEKPVNLPPVFKNLPSMEIKEGDYLELTIQADDPNNDPVVIFTKDLPRNADFDPVTSRLTFRPDYTQAGSYPFLLVATDGSLSTSALATIQVKDNDIAPVLQKIDNLVVAEGELLSIVFTAVDSGGDVLRYETDNLPRGAYLDPSNGNFLFTPDYNQAGSYSFLVRVEDPAGQYAEARVSLTVNNVNRQPVFNFIPSQFVESGSTVEFLVSAFDPDGDSLSFKFSSNVLPNSLFNPQTQVFQFTAGEQTGVFEGIFIVTDSPGASDSQVVAINVGPRTNLPPVVTAIPDQFFAEGDTVTLTLSATDPEGAGLTYSVFNQNELPSAMRQISTKGVYKFYADYNSAGRYRVVFQVSDGTLFTKIETKISIENRNRPPVLKPIGNQQVAEGSELELKFSATDPDGDALSYEISGLPRGARFDKKQGIFIFRPDFDEADSMSLGVIVSDGQASVAENFRLIVTNTNRPPVIRRVRDPEVDEGGLLEFEMEADDPDGDSVWVVIDTTKVPFLGEAMKKAARIRNKRSFIFDTGKLIEILRIPSAVLKFYALDKFGAKSDEEIVDIAVIRKILDTSFRDLPPGLAKKLEWANLGVQIAILNNLAGNISADIEVHERSGRLKQDRGLRGRSLLLSSLLQPESENDRKMAEKYRYTFLSASGEEMAFYGIRRGWGVDIRRGWGWDITKSPAEIELTVVFKYSDEDLPKEIEGFSESNLQLYGLDSLKGQFVKIEGAVVDTAKNEVTFKLSNFLLIDFTLGTELAPFYPSDTLNVKLLIDSKVVDTNSTDNSDGPYMIQAFAPQATLVSNAVLYYRTQKTGEYQSLSMSKISGEENGYTAEIQGLAKGGEINYYVQMTVNFETRSSPLNPLTNPYELIVKGKYIPGDVSGDSVINIWDLLEFLKVLSGSVQSKPACDVDENGSINIFDLLELLKLLSK